MLQIAIVNGPNLNLLGKRQPEIYGNMTFENYLDELKNQYNNIDIHYFQNNSEGEIINYLHSCMGKMQAIVINPGGYSHTSIAIADAIASIGIPVVEVHISNIYAREEFRRKSITATTCVGSIVGLGLDGYSLAVNYLLRKFGV